MTNNDSLSLVFSLPSTAETEIGPIIERRRSEITVRYDYDGEDGTEWTTLRFTAVAASRFTPDAAVTELMVLAYSAVAEL